MTRLAIVSSHPIQYNAPVFRALAARDDLDVKVFFSWRGTQDRPDKEFGRRISWDIPLTDGYPHVFVPNASRDPGTHHFMGLRNPTMCKEIEAYDPDVLLVYGWSSWTHLSVLRRFKGRIPIVFRGDSTLISSDRRWKAIMRKPVLTWVYRHIDGALYVGERNRDYFLAHGVPGERLSWAPHSIENARFDASACERQAQADAQRSALGIPRDATVFLFAGKLVPHKRPEPLVESFLRLAPEAGAPAPHLAIVGSGPLEAELRRLAVGNKRIHFVGFKNQSEMPIAYRLGDVFVLPSSRETWGLAVNEAMACARPVIVSDMVGCAPDLAVDPRFSFIFDVESASGLDEALLHWSKPRQQVLEAGQLAKDFIAAFSNEVAAGAIAEGVFLELRSALV